MAELRDTLYVIEDDIDSVGMQLIRENSDFDM